jgi:hypothetical protein
LRSIFPFFTPSSPSMVPHGTNSNASLLRPPPPPKEQGISFLLYYLSTFVYTFMHCHFTLNISTILFAFILVAKNYRSTCHMAFFCVHSTYDYETGRILRNVGTQLISNTTWQPRQPKISLSFVSLNHNTHCASSAVL